MRILAAFLAVTSFLTPAFSAGGLFETPRVEAAVNAQINYQGKLTDLSDDPVADGSYNVEFNLYTAATGGTAIWTETLTGSDRVSVTDGLFSVLLGSTTPFTGVDFNQMLYLGVTIGGSSLTPSWDTEMSPRKKLGAVPAALVADTLDGLDSTSFVRTNASSTITSGTTTVGVNAGLSVAGNFEAGRIVATSSATSTFVGGIQAAALYINGVASSTFANGINLDAGCFAVAGSCVSGSVGSGTQGQLGFYNTAGTALTATSSIFLAQSGNVGIGTSTPGSELTVSGDLQTVGSGAFGSRALVDGATLAASSDTQRAALSVRETLSSMSVDQYNAISSSLSIDPSAAAGGIIYGLYNEAVTLSGNANTISEVYAGSNRFRHNGAGTIDYAYAQYNVAANASGGKISELGGTWNQISAGADTNTVYGVYTSVSGPSSLSSGSAAVYGEYISLSSLSTLGATQSDAYGLYIASVSGADTNYSIYSAGGQAYFADNLGIGTTSPYAKLSVVGEVVASHFTGTTTATSSFGGPLVITSSATSTATNGINLSAGCFAINGVCVGGSSGTVGTGITGQLAYYAAGGTTLTATSSIFIDTANGYVGIGTTSPFAKFAVSGQAAADYFTAFATSATTTLAGGLNVGSGGLVYDFSSGVTSVSNLELGNLVFGADSGLVSWIDMPVTSAAAAGTVESIIAQIDSNPFLSLYAESNGAGGISTGRIGIGTSTPYARLTVWASSTTESAFTVVSRASSTLFTIDPGGNVGIGTTSPYAKLSVVGHVAAEYYSATSTTATSSYLGVLSVGSTTPASTALFAVGTSSPNFIINKFSGNVGVGTTSPYVKFAVAGEAGANYFTAFATSATTTLNGGLNVGAGAIVYDYTAGTVSIPNLQLGEMVFSADSGIVTLFDMPVTGNQSAASVNAYYTRINGTAVTSVYAEADGSGGIQNTAFGVGTTSPWARLSVTGNASTTRPNFVIASSTNIADFIVTYDGKVGIGTTSPYAKLSVVGQIVGEYFTATSTTATSTFGGALGVGTTSPFAKFAVSGQAAADYFTAYGTTSTSTIAGSLSVGGGAIEYNYGTGVTSIDNLELGNLGFDTDAGVVTWVDLPVTASSSSGIVQSYTARIDDNPLLTVYGESNGAGGISTGRIGIGTSTPYARLTVWASSTTESAFTVVSRASSTLFTIDPGGNVGIGTTSPYAKLSVVGHVAAEYYSATSTTATSSYLGVLSVGSTTPASTALFAVGTSSPNFIINKFSGNVGVGTTSPYVKFAVAGEAGANYFTAFATSATTTLNGGLNVGAGGLVYDYYTGQTSISNLELGALSFDTDAGIVTWTDMPVTSASATSSILSYSAQIDGSPILTVYALSDGQGGIYSTSTAVGIGTTTPTEALSVNGRLYVGGTGTSTVENNLHVIGTLRSSVSYVGDLVFANMFRFVEGDLATTVPQFLHLQNQYGDKMLTIGEDGNVGIGTTTPDYKLHVIGDVAATSFVNVSTRDAKKDIEYYDPADRTAALESLRSLKVAEYRYSFEEETAPLRLGLIAEEAPSSVLAPGGKGVDVYKLSTLAIAALQELDVRMTDLEARVAALEGGTSGTGMSLAALLSALSDLGSTFEQGAARFASVFADKATVRSLEIKADNVAETGITIYDRVTGAPSCFFLANGTMQTEAGACPTTTTADQGTSTTTPASDTTAPVIMLIGSNPLSIPMGVIFADMGATATDDIDESVETVQTENTVNTAVAGEYRVTYTATDLAGNTSSTTRTVVVGDPQVAPEPEPTPESAPESTPEEVVPEEEPTPEPEPEPESIPEEGAATSTPEA